MKIFRKEIKANGRRHIYLLGIKIFSYKKVVKISKYDKIYSKRFEGLSEKDMRYCLEVQFKKHAGYKLNLDNPKTFNEKLQWLKLYYHRHPNPLITKCADKVGVREYIKEKIGEEYLVPIIGIYDNVEDIYFSKLPEKFVLKVNWGSGQNILVKDKSQLNIDDACKKLREWMKPESNHYFDFFEPCYKDIKPKIIVEKYLDYEDDLLDYKVFCNNGIPKFLFVASDRQNECKFDFYDIKFNKLPVKQHYNNSDKEIMKPELFDKMLSISSILTKDFIHCRVDFYILDNKLFVGELTFFHNSGFTKIHPKKWEKQLGDWIFLPNIVNGEV
jgi:hypothetical protein